MGSITLIIELSNIEPPVGNGSSDVFVDMIEKVRCRGTGGDEADYTAAAPCLLVLKGISTWWRCHMRGIAISYTLNYPETAALSASVPFPR